MEELTIDLFEPGMSVLHRAGLGGLACTLNWLNQTGASIQRPQGSWSFDDRMVNLRWEGGTTGAADFFESLYGLAFRLDDGLIDLPGSYWPGDLRPEVKPQLHEGILSTILQFTKKNVKQVPSKIQKLRRYEIDETSLTVQYYDLVSYAHQSAWKALVSRKALRDRVRVDSTIAPGFSKRHNAHSSTYIELSPGLALASHFALVGTLSLALDPKSGVMVVPDVQNLKEFVKRR